jgi:hypothetical protein
MTQSLTELLREELLILREKYLFATDATLQDPVFEGMLREFNIFHNALSSILARVKRVSSALASFTDELDGLSVCISDQFKLAAPNEERIISDCYKYRECTNGIARDDAPHSTLSKFRRDLEYNILGPIRSHMSNCNHIHSLVDLRNRRLAELSTAERSGAPTEEKRKSFEDLDQHLFEWFMIIEEHKGDILDSLLQTVKYLEYEFFASSAHVIAAVLPARIEFRPMVEMTPKQLEAQLSLEKRAALQSTSETKMDYTSKLVQKIDFPEKSTHVEVDILSLSSLMAQGFEEGPARKALRECNNDTQSALEYLLGHKKEEDTGVRIPTTLKRIERIKQLRNKFVEKSNPQLPDLI